MMDSVERLIQSEAPWSFADFVDSLAILGFVYSVQSMGAVLSVADDVGVLTPTQIDDVSVLTPAQVEEILSAPDGQRPDPSTYLSSEYITKHLAQFDDGVSKITRKLPTDSIGPPGGTFVMPTSVADDIILRAGGNIQKLEELLSLNPGDLGAKPVRIDISNPKGLRMPSGNELGANNKWIPGGFNAAGKAEAIIDSVLLDEYNIYYIK